MTGAGTRTGDGHVVSVVIPTLGRQTIEGTRRALQGQTRPPDEVVEVLDVERRGVSWARNEGFRQSRGDLVALTDDDAVPPPDWIERLVGAIDRHDAAAAGGRFLETDDLLRRKSERKAYPDLESVDTEGWVGNGGNIMIRRAWLDACIAKDGYVYDESFDMNCGEDHEFVHRIRRRGAKLVFVPNPVTHLRRATPAGYFSFQFRRGRGIAHLYEAIRAAGAEPAVPQRGLIFGQDGRGGRARWAAALWKKAVGPFDLSSFTGPGQFAVFWIGEKLEGAGFLYELARRRISGRRTGARGAFR